MCGKIRKVWHLIGDTGIYTTGHYLVTVREVKELIRSKDLGNHKNLQKAENQELITAQLKADNRVFFYFFPFKKMDKYLMEGNASSSAVEKMESNLPDALKNFLIKKSPVQY